MLKQTAKLLKGIAQVFLKMGLYEVFMHSHCVTYSRQQSVSSQFGEAGQSPSVEVEQSTAVGRDVSVCSLHFSGQTALSVVSIRELIPYT